jgi:hypothetical protein
MLQIRHHVSQMQPNKLYGVYHVYFVIINLCRATVGHYASHSRSGEDYKTIEILKTELYNAP